MRRTRRRQGKPISSSQPQFQQVHISLIHINTNYHFCILSFLSLSLSFFHSVFPNSHFFQCEASAAPPHVLPLAEVEAAHRDQGSFFQLNLFQGSRSRCFALVPSFSSTIPYIFMHFPVQCSPVQRKEDNLFLFLSFFFLLLWLLSSFSVTISPGREENRARRELTWKASRLGLKSLPWSQRFSIPKLFGISRSSSNCSQILLSGVSAEAEWEWNEGSEGHGRQSKQCYEKVTIIITIKRWYNFSCRFFFF